MPKARRPAVAFVTLGCPKNEVDSDRMAASLGRSFELVADVEDADAVVVNTCSFISDATEESVAVVLELAGEWKTAAPGRLLVVAGCMPSRYGDELSAAMPEVDAFVPVAGEEGLRAVLASLTDADAGARADGGGAGRLAPGPSAYLQVSDGCHLGCTYCTIPSIRGAYRSRPMDEVLAEARQLVEGGAKELVLIGQDISSWGRGLPGDEALADLVREVAHVDGLRWLRLMYVQPDAITPDLLEVMTDEPAVCRYLDMPLQHASRDVLRRMGRRGDGAEYLRLISTIRGFMPDIFLRTSVIAGFPGETRADAARLQEFLRDARLDYVGVFVYSPEGGTPAADMPGQVPLRTRRARAQRLRDVCDEVGFEKASDLVGSTLEVLVEGIDEDGEPFGRHRGQAPEVDGVVLLDRDVPAGEVVMAEIVDALGYDLVARVRDPR
jgi:ribosomal protein S12 methylthiotransferase